MPEKRVCALRNIGKASSVIKGRILRIGLGFAALRKDYTKLTHKLKIIHQEEGYEQYAGHTIGREKGKIYFA